MNKKLINLIIFFNIFLVYDIYAQEIKAKPEENQPGVKRTMHYNKDGSIKSIVVSYTDGEAYKINYDDKGMLKEKVYPDGKKINYEFIMDNDGKRVIETKIPENITIKRVFNKKGEIILSEYPDRKEEYSYKYNKIGDIEKVLVKTDGKTEEELSPQDKRLSFLNDYDILQEDSYNEFKDMRDHEYLYNPTRYREKLMMHKKNQIR